MLGIVGSVLAVVSKRTQQIPKMLGPAVHRENETLEAMHDARA